MKQTRDLRLDLLRIIAGVAVVVIHTTDPFVNKETLFGGFNWHIANILNSVSRVSVPLFIMISGALLLSKKEIEIVSFLKRRVVRIGIPLLFWSFIYLFVYHLPRLSPEFFVTAFASGKVEHLYFLIIMLGLYLISPVLTIFLRGASDREIKGIIIYAFIYSFLLSLMHRIVPTINYQTNSLTLFIPYISYYLLGWYLKNHEYKGKVYKLFYLFVSLGLLNALLNILGTLADRTGVQILYSRGVAQYVYEPFSPLIIIETILLFIIVMNMNDKLKDYVSRYTGLVRHFSSTIFGIFLIHPLVIRYVDIYLHLGIDEAKSPLWGYMLVKMIIVLTVSYGIVAALRRIPYVSYLVG